MNQRVRLVLRTSGLTRLFAIYRSVDAAVLAHTGLATSSATSSAAVNGPLAPPADERADQRAGEGEQQPERF